MEHTEGKRLLILSFTKAGTDVSRRLCDKLTADGILCGCYAPARMAEGMAGQLPEDVKGWIGGRWGRDDFLFIGAAGIAVRMIAGCVRDKYRDSAVLVMDEKAQFVIPLLSGHVGGGVALACRIARALGAVPVVTTATDVRERFAVDVFAAGNHLVIADRETAKRISAAVLDGESVGIYGEPELLHHRPQLEAQLKKAAGEYAEIRLCDTEEELEQYAYGIRIGQSLKNVRREVLQLLPRNLLLGVGCRKGTACAMLEQGIRQTLARYGLLPEQTAAVASIDLKAEESGLLEVSERLRAPFLTYSAAQLQEITAVSSRSSFVERTTGVDNVCERAVKYVQRQQLQAEELLIEKQRLEKMTLAAGILAEGAGPGRIPEQPAEGRTPGQNPGNPAEGAELRQSQADQGKRRPRVLVFAGTTEGRSLAEFLNRADMAGRWETWVSMATEYGESLLEPCERVHLLQGRMDRRQIAGFLKKQEIGLVIDATHPFAVQVTENIRTACRECRTPYLRCLREQSAADVGIEADIVSVESVQEAVEYLKHTEGNIFVATGSKELQLYTEIPDYRERCYVRVLSVMESIEKAAELGFQGSHLIAMQGPFSAELNRELLKQTGAAYFVTKESGKTGGFEEKLLAARDTGTVPVVVGRPREQGMSIEEIRKYLKETR